MGQKEALALAARVDDIYVAKGSKFQHINMKEHPSKDELLCLLLGPTGNLRAPAIKQGRKLFVGFNADAYKHLIG
jgi:arsenate reductase-like glutaredoxin family protein